MGLCRKRSVQIGKNLLQIADNRSVCFDVFIDFSRININMQLFCLRSEGLRIADDAIGKTGSQCN